MNYFKLIHEFYNRLVSNPLSTGQIALWHGLVYQCNRLGWPSEFNMPMRTLEMLTDLSASGVKKARNALKQAGLIEFESNGTKATTYRVMDITPQFTMQDSSQDSVQDSSRNSVQSSVQDSSRNSVRNSSAYLNRTKTKQNKTKKTDSQTGGVTRQQSIQAWENLWGFPNAIALQDLTEWCGEFGDDLVTYVINYAARRNVQAKSANSYLDRVLSGYRAAGITTVEQAETEAEKHRKRMETTASQRKAAQRPHYGKQPVVEDKPSWEQPDHTAPSKRLTPAEQAALDAKLASLRKPKDDQQDTAQPDQATDIFAGLGRADAFDGMHLG